MGGPLKGLILWEKILIRVRNSRQLPGEGSCLVLWVFCWDFGGFWGKIRGFWSRILLRRDRRVWCTVFLLKVCCCGLVDFGRRGGLWRGGFFRCFGRRVCRFRRILLRLWLGCEGRWNKNCLIDCLFNFNFNLIVGLFIYLF